MRLANKVKNISALPFRIQWGTSLSPRHLVNRYKLLRAFLSGSSYIETSPVLLHVEVTNRCNLRCVMCGRNVKEFMENTDISFDLFKRIVDQAVDMGIEMLILHSFGESLLHPQIIAMIEYATQKGMPTWMSTNATLLTEEMSTKILQSGLCGLVFSVDGTTPATYESIRKGARYETTVNNIIRFLDLKKKIGVGMMNTIQLIEMDQNKHEVDDFIKMWSQFNINILIKPLVDWYAHDVDPSRPRNFRCDRPWYWMKIQSSGKVLVCGHDTREQYVMGDTNKETLKDIWNSPAYRGFRTQMRENWQHIDICRNCRYKPPRRRNVINNMAFVGFDVFSLTQILFTIGYKKEV